MSASRLFHLSSSLFRRKSFPSFPPHVGPSSHHPPPRLSSISVLRPLAGTPLPRLIFYTSSSAAVDGPAADTEEPATSASHPWPEWERFLDKLRSKGYFEISSSAAAPAKDDDESPAVSSAAAESAATMELNRVKNACLKFARERFDILRSLPKEDIQAIVECGCPNLFRKAVNSAKRLRAFLLLDEGDVCGNCNLKGSCDKAYITAKEDEAARTVDVVRILLTYAVNPAALAGSENLPVKVPVQESARKLLSKLIKLSDTTIDPALPKPSVQSPSQKEPSQKSINKNNLSQNVEMKRGDWLCPNCNFLNFARNVRCLECKEDGPKRVNFDGAEMKLGDWTCPKCEFMNFARNNKCFRCQVLRPKRELNPGEWECPSCNFLNFRRNKVCLKCDCARPNDEGCQFEDHAWRKPKVANNNTLFKFGDDEDDVDDDEDILPLQNGERRFVVSKRATPAERRSTSARKRGYPS